MIHVRRLFRRRTDALLTGAVANVMLLAVIGLTGNFWLALALLAVWAMAFAVSAPVRQAFVNGVAPSEQRATVLSFDNMMSSAGGVVTQPALGRVADVFGYPSSYVASAAIIAVAVPFVVLARRENASSDPIAATEPAPAASPT